MTRREGTAAKATTSRSHDGRVEGDRRTTKTIGHTGRGKEGSKDQQGHSDQSRVSADKKALQARKEHENGPWRGSSPGARSLYDDEDYEDLNEINDLDDE